MVKKFFDTKWFSLILLSIFTYLVTTNIPVLESDFNSSYIVSAIGLFLTLIKFLSQVFPSGE